MRVKRLDQWPWRGSYPPWGVFSRCAPAVGSAIAPRSGGRLRFSTSVGLRVRRSDNSLRDRLNPAATRATALISSSQFHFGNGRDGRSAPGRSFQDEWSWSKDNSHSYLRILQGVLHAPFSFVPGLVALHVKCDPVSSPDDYEWRVDRNFFCHSLLMPRKPM